MSETKRDSVEEFFQQTNWGQLVAIKCYCTSPFIDKEVTVRLRKNSMKLLNYRIGKMRLVVTGMMDVVVKMFLVFLK